MSNDRQFFHRARAPKTCFVDYTIPFGQFYAFLTISTTRMHMLASGDTQGKGADEAGQKLLSQSYRLGVKLIYKGTVDSLAFRRKFLFPREVPGWKVTQ